METKNYIKLAQQGLDFEILLSLPRSLKKHKKPNTLKNLFERLTPTKTKYKEVWRRVRMKLKYKSLLSKLYHQIQEINILPNQNQSLSSSNDKSTSSLSHSKHIMNNENTSKFILHPNSLFREVWNFFISILLLYTATIMPLTMAFFESDSKDTWYYLDFVLDTLFFLDIIVTINSAYYNQYGVLLTKRKTIFCNYVKSWFFIDIVSCIPFNVISGSGRSYNSLLRLARLPRLAKLLRLSKLLKIFKSSSSNDRFMRKIEDILYIKTSVMRLFQGFMTAVLLLHLMSCLWFYSARFQDFNPDTWVVKYGYLDLDIGSLYLRSLYFAMTTLATVGYGDIAANNDLERILVIIWIIIVMFFVTFSISSISNMMSSIDTKESVLQYKVSVIDNFCKEFKLSNELKFKIKEAIKYSTENTGVSLYNKQDIIIGLPKKLRFEVSMAMHKGYAKNIKFFQEKDSAFISNIIPFLFSQKFLSGDVIYNFCDHPDEVYFIIEGRVGFIYGEKKVVFQQVEKSQDFGFIEIFISSPRIFTSKAMINTKVFTLKKYHLDDIVKKYTYIEHELKKKAENEKMKSLRNIIELKVIFQLKKDGSPFDFTLEKIRKHIKNRFIDYQKIWRDFEIEELGSADLLLTSDTLNKKIEEIRELHDKIYHNVQSIAEKTISRISS